MVAIFTSSALLLPLWLTMPCFSFVWSNHAISYPNLHIFVSESDAIYSYSWKTGTHWDCVGQTPMCGPPTFEEWLPSVPRDPGGAFFWPREISTGLRWSFCCFSTRNFSHKWTDKIRPGGSRVWWYYPIGIVHVPLMESLGLFWFTFFRGTWLVFPSVKDSISFLKTNLYYICYHTASVSCFDSFECLVGS